MHKFGVYPIIVTRNWNPDQTTTYARIEDNTYKHRVYPSHEEYFMPYQRSWRDRLFTHSSWLAIGLRRLLTFLELVFSGFTFHALPYANLYSQARKILREQKDIEVLLISGSPFESFHFGYLLKKEFPHLHWIPSYRDEWTAFRRYPSNGFFEHLLFRFQTYLEKRFTSNATAFMSVSDFWVEQIAQHIQKQGFKVMNGFEPLEAGTFEAVSLDPHSLKIAHAGSIYPNQDFAPLVALLAKLKVQYATKVDIQMDFYGIASDSSDVQDIQELFLKVQLVVNWYPRIPQKALHERLVHYDIVYVSKYGNFNGLIPVKVFDYYNLGIPMLHYPSDKGEIEEFMRSTQTGICSADEVEVYHLLVEFIDNKLSKNDALNKVRYQKKSAEEYTRAHQASILASHIHALPKLN